MPQPSFRIHGGIYAVPSCLWTARHTHSAHFLFGDRRAGWVRHTHNYLVNARTHVVCFFRWSPFVRPALRHWFAAWHGIPEATWRTRSRCCRRGTTSRCRSNSTSFGTGRRSRLSLAAFFLCLLLVVTAWGGAGGGSLATTEPTTRAAAPGPAGG